MVAMSQSKETSADKHQNCHCGHDRERHRNGSGYCNVCDCRRFQSTFGVPRRFARKDAELAQSFSAHPTVEVDLATALLIRRAFVPRNPRKMRGCDESVRQAALRFIEIVELAAQSSGDKTP